MANGSGKSSKRSSSRNTLVLVIAVILLLLVVGYVSATSFKTKDPKVRIYHTLRKYIVFHAHSGVNRVFEKMAASELRTYAKSRSVLFLLSIVALLPDTKLSHSSVLTLSNNDTAVKPKQLR